MSTLPDDGIALIGTGALALEIVELFGVATFTSCYSDPEFVADARVELPLFSDLQQLRQKARYFALGVALAKDRVRLSAMLVEAGLEPCPPLILPGAVVSPSATLGAGSIIGHGVHVGSRSKIGPHNLVMHNAVLGHDLNTAEHVIVGPNVFVAGYVTIGQCTVVNALASLGRGICVGEHVFIAPGAACFRDISMGCRAVGNPAKVFSPSSK